MVNTPVAAVVAADASIGPQVAAVGYSVLLHGLSDTLRVQVLGSEAIPTGLSVAESELMALVRGQNVLYRLFNSIPSRLELVRLLFVTDNIEVYRSCVKREARSPVMAAILDNLLKRFFHVPTEIFLIDDATRRLIADGKMIPSAAEAANMLGEAHLQAKSYKRQLGSILDE